MKSAGWDAFLPIILCDPVVVHVMIINSRRQCWVVNLQLIFSPLGERLPDCTQLTEHSKFNHLNFISKDRKGLKAISLELGRKKTSTGIKGEEAVPGSLVSFTISFGEQNDECGSIFENCSLRSTVRCAPHCAPPLRWLAPKPHQVCEIEMVREPFLWFL